MDAQEAKRLVLERHPEARYTDSGIGTGVIQANDGVLGDSMMSPEHEGAEDAAWIAAEIASRLSPQPETAQGDQEIWVGSREWHHREDMKKVAAAVEAMKLLNLSEPSQQENAPQPQQDKCPQCGSMSREKRLARHGWSPYCWDDWHEDVSNPQPQPAESDGFEGAYKDRFPVFCEVIESGKFRGALTAEIARDHKEAAAWGWQAKLSSLLAQKPEATVSFDRLAEVYNDSPLDGSVSHLCIEVMKYRQLLKDAEKGQGK